MKDYRMYIAGAYAVVFVGLFILTLRYWRLNKQCEKEQTSSNDVSFT